MIASYSIGSSIFQYMILSDLQYSMHELSALKHTVSVWIIQGFSALIGCHYIILHRLANAFSCFRLCGVFLLLFFSSFFLLLFSLLDTLYLSKNKEDSGRVLFFSGLFVCLKKMFMQQLLLQLIHMMYSTIAD